MNILDLPGQGGGGRVVAVEVVAWRARVEPLYKRVKRELTELLGAGVWRPSQPIPSERKLVERFGVSTGTLRRAIDELVAEGVLVRYQGRGTFVSAHDRSRYLFRFFNICGHDGQRTYPVVRLLDFGLQKADAATGRDLAIRPGARIFRIRNLLSFKGVPTLVDEILLPAARFAGMDRACIAERKGTLYQLYEEAFGNSISRIDERLRAAAADDFLAAELGLAPAAPLLQIVRRALAIDGTPVELRHSFVSTEYHEYSQTLSEADRQMPAVAPAQRSCSAKYS